MIDIYIYIYMLANIINLAAGQATWYRGGEGAGGGGG